jgi:hypothetical protein
MSTIKKNTEALLWASRYVGLEVNVEKTKFMFIYRHQNSGKIIFTDCNISFENVAKCKRIWENSNESELHSRRN